MEIYIVEDDLSVINNLEEIMEQHQLGNICGDSGEEAPDVSRIMARNPDIILVDLLMPQKDGIQVVRELREQGCKAKCIMLSQVSDKELVGKAYDAGVDFFISKPINLIEVKSVISNVSQQIQNERTLSNIRKMFLSEKTDVKDLRQEIESQHLRKLQGILNQLGMSGEKGCGDILQVCQYLYENQLPISQTSVGQLCETLSASPKNMEQRIRRAIAQGMSNLAHLGIEDFMNDTFTRYSGSLFPFEEIKAEMDFVRGKRTRGGKVSVKKFIDGLLIFTE